LRKVAENQRRRDGVGVALIWGPRETSSILGVGPRTNGLKTVGEGEGGLRKGRQGKSLIGKTD